MAGQRRSPAAAAKDGAGPLTCPDCGREFKTAAALGSHRSRVHGVAGTSRKNSAGSASSRGRRAAGGARSPVANSRASQAGARRAQAARATSSGAGFDRDALLKAVFPNGIPANAQLLEALGPWLAEAERLSQIA